MNAEARTCRLIRETNSGPGKGTPCGSPVVETLHGIEMCAAHSAYARRVNGLPAFANPLSSLLDSALSIGCYVDLFEAAQPGATEQLVKWAESHDLAHRTDTHRDAKLGMYRITKVEHGSFRAWVTSRRIADRCDVDVSGMWRPEDRQ